MDHYVSDHAVAIDRPPSPAPGAAPAGRRKRRAIVALGAVIVGVAAVGAVIRVLSGAGPEAAVAEAATATAASPAEQRPVRAASACASCGTVESVRFVEVAGETGQPAGKRTVYRVTIRMDDGSYRTISHTAAPGIGAGEKVRVVDGAVVAGR